MIKVINKIFGGDKSTKENQKLSPVVNQINAHYKAFGQLSNDELRLKSANFRSKISSFLRPIDEKIEAIQQQIDKQENNDHDLENIESWFKQIADLQKERDKQTETILWTILPEAFATVKQTALRFTKNEQLKATANELDKTLSIKKPYIKIEDNEVVYQNTWDVAGTEMIWNMIHFDVQLLGGIILHKGKIAEMATGEGKTLVSTLPAYLNALAGKGVHIVTVNDYLARRDSEWNAPIFEWLGITVGCIDKHAPNSTERRSAYNSDITYGTNNEFGFDYLRDNMVRESTEITQRNHHYAIIDEVDSVLIDDARTPLIISGPVPASDDRQTFLEFKPRVASLVEAQRQLVSSYLLDAKRKIAEGNEDPTNLGFDLMRVYKGLPQHSAFVKLLSEPGVKVKLQKAEAYYLAEQQKQMYKVEQDLYFVIDEKNKSVVLTDKGLEYITKQNEDSSLFILPDISMEMDSIDKNNTLSPEDKVEQKDQLVDEYAKKSDRLHSIQQLLKAYTLFVKDVEYVVVDGQVKIVDEQTGRIMEGRRYSDGLHQALEAKENVDIESSSQTYATVSLQNYFRMYHKLSGMTGTAETESAEFWDIYKLDVTVVPTHKPTVRNDKDDLIFKTKREKYKAVIESIEQNRKQGQPTLVGTTSVETSELISKMLNTRKIKHNVLNAKQHAKEATVIAEAGYAGAVTIATNMAGRGTDIKLGPNVKENGGLMIIGTERHESRRVDRQLRGRSGRQGDPGGTQFFVSLEDDLMRIFGSERIAKWMDRLGLKEGEVIQHSMVTNSITRAQKKVEENNFGIRKHLLDYDDVMNKQRNVIYQKRKHALSGERLRIDIDNSLFSLVNLYSRQFEETNDRNQFTIQCLMAFGIDIGHLIDDKEQNKHLKDQLYTLALEKYNQTKANIIETTLPIFKRMHIVHADKENANVIIPYSNGKIVINIPTPLHKSVENEGRAIISSLEKSLMLALIDQSWKEHLRGMEQLRQSVQTSYLEQKDPLVIYKIESFNLFEEMNNQLNQKVVSFLAHATVLQKENEDVAVNTEKTKDSIKNQSIKTRKDSIQAILNNSKYNDPSAASRDVKHEPITVEKRVGRNEACPCGSGKKYKHCHGKVTVS